jgi:hypothetical protein
MLCHETVALLPIEDTRYELYFTKYSPGRSGYLLEVFFTRPVASLLCTVGSKMGLCPISTNLKPKSFPYRRPTDLNSGVYHGLCIAEFRLSLLLALPSAT